MLSRGSGLPSLRWRPNVTGLRLRINGAWKDFSENARRLAAVQPELPPLGRVQEHARWCDGNCLFSFTVLVAQTMPDLALQTGFRAGFAIDLHVIKRQDTVRFKQVSSIASFYSMETRGVGGSRLVQVLALRTVKSTLYYLSRGFHEGSCCCQTSC